MALLTAADIARMKADSLALMSDNAVSIVIRRDVNGSTTTLPAQIVRAERKSARGRATRLNSGASEESRSQVTVLGDLNLDIQINDRFTLGGNLYRVRFIRPNTQINVQAEAELVE